jgi:hypothetical protein
MSTESVIGSEKTRRIWSKTLTLARSDLSWRQHEERVHPPDAALGREEHR